MLFSSFVLVQATSILACPLKLYCFLRQSAMYIPRPCVRMFPHHGRLLLNEYFDWLYAFPLPASNACVCHMLYVCWTHTYRQLISTPSMWKIRSLPVHLKICNLKMHGTCRSFEVLPVWGCDLLDAPINASFPGITFECQKYNAKTCTPLSQFTQTWAIIPSPPSMSPPFCFTAILSWFSTAIMTPISFVSFVSI